MMGDYREIFKREKDRLNYLYAKANTKSKKERLAYDLILFSDMYNRYVKENVSFDWDDDIIIINESQKVLSEFISNMLGNKDNIVNLIKNNFDMFSLEKFSVYSDYAKDYHNISVGLAKKYIIDFFKTIDNSLAERFIHKLANSEMFICSYNDDNLGATYRLDAVDKSVIIFAVCDKMTIYNVGTLVHEMGHDFEFENAKNSGITNAWNKMLRTPYVEVSSSFFEYAFINYLIDNRIYLDDAMMLKRSFLKRILYNFLSILIICKMENWEIDSKLEVKIKDIDTVNYANELSEKMNLFSYFKIEDKMSFRNPFIYGVGELLGIYAYEVYKDDPKEFLSKFKKVLIEYNNSGMEAFYQLGISESDLLDGNILRKVLRESK